MTDEKKKPQPAPRDWNLHIERDVSWMLNPNTSQDDRERYAARIRDMVYRVKDIGVEPANADVVFTLLFHKDLSEEDAIDIDIAIKTLAIIAARRGGGIIIQSRKADGGQVAVPVLIPMVMAPDKGIN